MFICIKAKIKEKQNFFLVILVLLPSRITKGIKGLPGVSLHVVPQHVLEPSLHRIRLGDSGCIHKRGEMVGGAVVRGHRGHMRHLLNRKITYGRFFRFHGGSAVCLSWAEGPSFTGWLWTPVYDWIWGDWGRWAVRGGVPLFWWHWRRNMGVGVFLNILREIWNGAAPSVENIFVSKIF